MKDVSIYTETIRDTCFKKPIWKPKDPPTIHVMRKLSNFIMKMSTTVKYDDLGNLVITVQINQTNIPNTLLELGGEINVMNTQTPLALGLSNLRPTPTI